MKILFMFTDNGSNYVLVGKLLDEEKPHLYWILCATHGIDLLFEDIGKLHLIIVILDS